MIKVEIYLSLLKAGENVANRNICGACVGDKNLKKWIKSEGMRGRCLFCKGKPRRTAPLWDLADVIDAVIRNYYKPTYEQEGETAEWIIHDIAEVDLPIAKEIDKILAENEFRSVADGDDAWYRGATNLVPIGIYAEDPIGWYYLEDDLKHKNRFFNEELKRSLDEVFDGLDSLGDGDTIVTIDPGSALSTIFRARVAENANDARRFVKNPDRELGPPPIALAGRMNAGGITVFYGAFSLDVAVAEVRPPIGSLVVIGEFFTTRSIRLLDLTFLARAYHRESYFSPDFDRLAQKVAFLEQFHRRLSRPIQPTMEPLEYLPTQAFAEYVDSILGLDGMIYRSVQIGAWNEDIEAFEPHKCNVVLFAKTLQRDEAGEKDKPAIVVKPESTKVHRIEAAKIDHSMLSFEDEDYVSIMFDPEELAEPPVVDFFPFHTNSVPLPKESNDATTPKDDKKDDEKSGSHEN